MNINVRLHMRRLFIAALLLVTAGALHAQAGDPDQEALQRAAMDALIAAPAERALPLARKVLEGDYSEALKERALFVLSQIDMPEAREALVAAARTGEGELRREAVRMIGIGGDEAALDELKTLYAGGDAEMRESVLEAYLIAGDEDAVYDLAANATSPEEFEAAVRILGAMGATGQLSQLRDKAGASEEWIHALAISGEAETLKELALDGSDPRRQLAAIQGLGIVGGDDVEQTLVDVYRNAGSDEVREAALQGLLIAGHDEGVVELYRASTDPAEKKELLQYLVMMDSDAVWELIDNALGGNPLGGNPRGGNPPGENP
ncbi:MAG TPA: HEAT repeat domain-containing protein [Woeseiaceae bacterium]|nr:HEAT repeat domain-containing protein [Woeseiaceae bacterium]